MGTPRKKRHRRSGPLAQNEKVAGFFSCLARAGLMRDLYERHVTEHPELEQSRGLSEEPAHWSAFTLACFHLACLYETLRAFRAVGQEDSAVDQLLGDDLEGKLRDFRDYAFHFTSPADERMLAMMGDPTRPVVRAYSLHAALDSFANRLAGERDVAEV